MNSFARLFNLKNPPRLTEERILAEQLQRRLATLRLPIRNMAE